MSPPSLVLPGVVELLLLLSHPAVNLLSHLTKLQLSSQDLKTSRDKTMADKLMYIPNDDIQNYPSCRLQFVVETFEYKIQ